MPGMLTRAQPTCTTRPSGELLKQSLEGQTLLVIVEDLQGEDLIHDSREEDLRHYGFIVYAPKTCDTDRIRAALAALPPR